MDKRVVPDGAIAAAEEVPATAPSPIRIPDQRVRVFVSSTLQELAPERRAARAAIERLRLTPVMFELGARPHPPRALYRAYLVQSDVFVGIYWQRYGWIAPGEAISGLEDEYQLAGDKPKLIYVKQPASDAEERLTTLIEQIQRDDTASYKPFGTPKELRALLENDLALLLTERFDRVRGRLALSLPTGIVTFLFTDVEGSTRLWEQHPDAMGAALARHDAIIEDEVQRHGGVVVRPRGEGDSRFAVFARATAAVAAAVAIQVALHAEPWPAEVPLHVRVALHTGEADLREGDYFGSAVNRCARLRALAHGGQVVLSMSTVELVGDALPPGASLRELGAHRLRDLQRPERVFQLLYPDLPADFPPLRSLDTLPNNLPAQMTSFIGRERALAELATLLSSTRLLTLTGTGGCGKTRLALHLAADVLDAYPDGAWFVDLAPLSDDALVSQAALTALGTREVPGRSPQAALADYLRSRRLLLVLDNCEHLLDGCARLVEALLRDCPGLRVLATSRSRLGVAGEVAWRVPSLALPDPHDKLPTEQLADYEAVRLFAERARLVQPDFVVDERNAAAVAAVCRRLDGIPLAIELAAARVRVLSVEQIAARLHDRFRLLTGGSRTAIQRQQTLRALIDWSYDLLTAPERALLRRLAVFAGGWTLEAAEEVASDGAPEGETRGIEETASGVTPSDVLDLLTSLVDQSLVVVDVLSPLPLPRPPTSATACWKPSGSMRRRSCWRLGRRRRCGGGICAMS